MRMRIAGRVVFACAVLCCSNVWAWNGTGHQAVADVAWDNLTPTTKTKVTELLKQHPDYARALMKETTPAGDKRDREAFMVAATWPDLIRSASFGKSHELAHSNWHYIDVPYVIGNVKAPDGYHDDLDAGEGSGECDPGDQEECGRFAEWVADAGGAGGSDVLD